MQHVISPVPSLARLPRRKKPPTWLFGSYTLKYIDSLKFGSGPSSCMYSSCGSNRTPMRPKLGEGRGRAQMLRQRFDRRPRVEPTARWHDVDRSSSDGALLRPRHRLAINGRSPTGEADERD